ncbi:hypothetical protein GWG65_17415 [Bradyrhizobium sp. CSA207]|uniref:hypothetical protein n=1 Tax=Bradyrhizobium sp. CSA207 TaxID=2698826 RepID=UPI0023AFA9A4|nr:hypothetical protein [Bradyrhizobium sp. CSA207]MDE5443198.1 hypothetical protein [Bradyrhizobium sp. CSA207]
MKSTRDSPSVPVQPNVRRRAVLEAARKLGLLGGESRRIGGRVWRDLVAAAKKKSGITSDTELIEYALAEVALEDDFGTRLIRRKGRVAKDVDLEF